MDNKKIVLIISTETIVHSFVKDVITASTIAVGIVLNTLTINVGWLNFWLGLVGLIFVVSNVAGEMRKRVVRGSTSDEVFEVLRERLAKEGL